MLTQSFQLMAYGLAGVFGALAVLYVTVRVMVKALTSSENKKGGA